MLTHALTNTIEPVRLFAEHNAAMPFHNENILNFETAKASAKLPTFIQLLCHLSALDPSVLSYQPLLINLYVQRPTNVTSTLALTDDLGTTSTPPPIRYSP